MAALYSQRFFAGNFAAGLSGALFTVPSSHIIICRSISFWANTGPGTAEAVIAGIAVFAGTPGALAAGSGYFWDGRQVLNAGEQLKVNVSAGNFDVVCSGYLLST